jgi:ATP-dependent DNA ligase
MIYSIIEQLRSTNSRLGKETILEANVNNDLLKSVLTRTFAPHINYYQRKIPAYSTSGNLDLKEALEQLNDLADRKVTGNKAIEFLSNILSSVSARDAFVIECIIKKDLGCGIGIPTVNKIWKDLIPTFDVMLCSPLSDKVLAKIKYPAMAQLKMDGLRCNVVVKDNTVTFYSRNGKTFDLLGNLEQEFIDAARGLDVVFDGELLVTKDSKVVDRQTGNGILNKANKGTISEEEAKLVTMTVWDIISYDNWIAGKDSMIYVHRYNRLISLNLRGKINIVPSIEVRSLDEAKIVYENYYAKGYEGIILKNTDNIWEPKRSQTQIKFKGEETASLHVVGIQHGNGKYEGQIGSLICESEDGELMVNVGSGLTDEDRLRTDFIGKIIDVKYNAKIKSKGSDTWSLFLPRFLEIRFDRDTADTIDHIK